MNQREAPSQEIFEEMRRIATQIWQTYDNTYGYVDEKLNYINSISNIQDNAMVMWRGFDHWNQQRFAQQASPEVLEYIKRNQ